MPPRDRLPELVVFESSPERCREFKSELAACSRVEVVNRDEDELWTYEGLDAVYVSIPMAERWGAKPRLYEAQLLPTSLDERNQGIPAYVIAGVALDLDDQRSVQAVLELVLEKTIQVFLDWQGADVPRRVGIASRHLLLNELPVATVARILREWLCPSGAALADGS
jgi:hypothetical protein